MFEKLKHTLTVFIYLQYFSMDEKLLQSSVVFDIYKRTKYMQH